MLVVGVDQGTLNWGYRDPRTGTINGLDVDILRQIAVGHLRRRSRRGPPVQDAHDRRARPGGEVGQGRHGGQPAHRTCDRWNDVDFSTVYYEAHQDVLVRIGRPWTRVADLAGKTVCATRGSTSITKIQQQVPTAQDLPRRHPRRLPGGAPGR